MSTGEVDGELDWESVVEGSPDCTWSGEQQGYVATWVGNKKLYPTAAQAKALCATTNGCGGITSAKGGTAWQLRASHKVLPSPANEVSYAITNAAACHPPAPIATDPMWVKRGVAAYTGLNRTDPEAIWSFQGWAFIGWNSNKQGGYIKSFIESAPAGKFNIIDMSTDGDGE